MRRSQPQPWRETKVGPRSLLFTACAILSYRTQVGEEVGYLTQFDACGKTAWSRPLPLCFCYSFFDSISNSCLLREVGRFRVLSSLARRCNVFLFPKAFGNRCDFVVAVSVRDGG